MTLSTKLPDFDTLMAMHQKDPAAFEQFRKEMLQSCVNEALQHQRPALNHLLFRIDEARENAASPLDAAAGACKMMADSVAQLGTAFRHLQHVAVEVQTAQMLQRIGSK